MKNSRIDWSAKAYLSYDDLSIIEPEDLMEMGQLTAEQVDKIVETADERALEAEKAAAVEKERRKAEQAEAQKAEAAAKAAAAAQKAQAEQAQAASADSESESGPEVSASETEAS